MFPARSPQPALFKNARKKLRCSQAQLARRLRVHRSTISRFEKGTLCPDAHHIETIEQLTGMAAEALITNFYSCAGRLEKSAEQVAQQAPEYYEYLHVKLCHEKKLHHLRWQLKRKQLDLATVNRCFTIDQTVMGALDAQIECLERIAHALKDSQAFEDAQAILNDYQQSKKAKSRIALIWARRFSFELEDEIKVMAQEIALRERLLQEAQAKADAIEAEKKRATVKQTPTAVVSPPTPGVLRPHAPRNTKAPPEGETPVIPMAPRIEKVVSPAYTTMTSGRKHTERAVAYYFRY